MQEVHTNGGVICAIAEGGLALLRTGLLEGQRSTGNRVVSYLLERLGTYEDLPVACDDRFITGRNAIDTPAVLREIARHFDPTYEDEREGVLSGKKIVIVAGEDFEDVELVAPFLEFLHRGADVTFGTFPPPTRSRPPMISEPAVMGSFGVSVPLQEVSADHYELLSLEEIEPADANLVMIPGAFCPWNMVAAQTPIDWLKRMNSAEVPIAAICHAAIPLCTADLVQDRRCAGVSSCKEHIVTMGGHYDGSWSAVVDGPIVTGLVPFDVLEFVDAMPYSVLA